MTTVPSSLAGLDVASIRQRIRQGEWTGTTNGLALGYAQTNLVALPKEYALDFAIFCFRNPAPCALLDITDVGSPVPTHVAPGADLRTDLPRYRVWENGDLVDEPTDVGKYWRDDLVGFLIGCSLTFESALLRAGVPVRHLECECRDTMYISNIDCRPAGIFRAKMVVTMHPIPADKVARAIQITSRFPATHGAPVHVGDPSLIGIESLDRIDFGDPVPIHPGEVPVFWGCGITSQIAARTVRPPFMITHAPGHMFITDRQDEEVAIL